MEVLKDGISPEKKKWYNLFICKYCKAELKVEQDDIYKWTEDDGYSMGTSSYYGFLCGFCKKQNTYLRSDHRFSDLTEHSVRKIRA